MIDSFLQEGIVCPYGVARYDRSELVVPNDFSVKAKHTLLFWLHKQPDCYAPIVRFQQIPDRCNLFRELSKEY